MIQRLEADAGHDRAYVFAGLAIASAVALPELPSAAPSETVRYRIDASEEPLVPDRAPDARHDWLDRRDAVTLTGVRRGDARCLIFPDVAQARIEPGGRMRVWRDRAADAAAFHHAILDQFLPRLLAGDGALMLHAAAVVGADGRALLILGETGCGKSTLCAALVRAGARLLTDDCVRVAVDAGGARAIPGYPGIRLLPDSLAALYGNDVPATVPMADYTAKRRILGVGDAVASVADGHGGSASARSHRGGAAISTAPAADGDVGAGRADRARGGGVVAAANGADAAGGASGRHASAPALVSAIVVLRAPDAAAGPDVRIEPLASADACMASVQNSFALDPTDLAWVRAQLARAARVTRAAPAYALACPRDYARLPEVIARLRDLPSSPLP